VRAAVIERYGEEVVRAGRVDRARVAERAFASAEERAWLEGMLWPLVGERVAAWLEGVRAMEPPPRAAVMEVPLLFESGMDGACDATIALVAGERLRGARVADREHVGVAERSARQLSEEEKARRATFVVLNDGTLEQLERELSDVLGKLQR
jgi:dephospho-CoA kinase